ncbi:DNA-binding PadR family transcriptional regulator [Arcanobacterium wilhelmae]|uniref:DNA-binding PadR family transcriptional regulator n=1 Tax=Arcanobacterium wilhelmae TaxID=1803177 RepID=A0ABT9NBU0_9ACTO|nr:PadR family transcriptional regulator [Arcanobacterium wilhelmae]MDP9801184.1 DNA-binding PadR family transcriptional regulator [Arcanobacterium wilhelmae]WFN90536.1 PadR family transcriptional regulator [Arcanobacterium wilhelmae]
MAVRDVLLWLLAEQPQPVYQLRDEFEARTDHIWPMNVGQVYQTVRRLERDGLVESLGEVEGKSGETYAIAGSGREVLDTWLAAPILRPRDERDDLVMRIAVGAGAARNLTADIHAQRMATLAEIRAMTKELSGIPEENLTAQLLAQRRIFDLEAQGRWLDHIERIIARHAAAQPDAGDPPPGARATTIEPNAPARTGVADPAANSHSGGNGAAHNRSTERY